MKLDKIADSDFDIVSFDIFDTLIIRPFYTPTDLFYLIENKIQKKVICLIILFRISILLKILLKGF